VEFAPGGYGGPGSILRATTVGELSCYGRCFQAGARPR
jgi:hypothetical protein